MCVDCKICEPRWWCNRNCYFKILKATERERREREERVCVCFEREWKRKDRIIFFLVCTEWLQEEEHWVREG